MKRSLLIILATLLIGWQILGISTPHSYADTTNLISNPSAETLGGSSPSNWTANSWGTNNATLSLTSSAHSGSKAMQVTMTSYTDGDAKWMPDAVTVTAGQTYTYNDYTKASVTTQLVAAYTATNNAVSYAFLGNVQPSTDWQQNQIDITMPANTQKVTILHLLQAPGTLTLDDISLAAKQQVVVTPPTSGNLIADPSMETADGSNPAGWQTDSWGTNNASFSYLTTGGHTGNASARLQMTSYTDGDAKWYFTPVSVQPNTSYTFSDYYKATIPTALVVRFDDGTGHYTYIEPTDPASAADWAQTTTTFTTPSTAKYVTVLHLLEGVGTLQIDDASLVAVGQTTTPPPTTTNLFPNPSVETVSSTSKSLPQNWAHSSWGTNTATFSYLTTTGHTGTHSLRAKISSYTSGAVYWHSDAIPVSGNQLYNYTDYYQSNIPSEVDASVILADGSEQDIYLGSAFESPNQWTKFNLQFTTPANAVSITLTHSIYSVGQITTDDFSLTPFSYQGFNRPLVSITDDDGFASFYNNGLPVLQKYGLPSTAYIISSYLDAPDYITTNQLLGLQAAGVEIGSHSVDHADLSTQGTTAQDNELKNSQNTLQAVLGTSVTDYAAPYGAYNQQIVTDAQKYYQTYRGVRPGYNAKNNFDVMNLQVQNVESTTTVAEIQLWLQQAAATNTWLILVYHEIDTTPFDSVNNTLPSDFDAQMAAVKNSGLTVKSVANALAEITPQL